MITLADIKRSEEIKELVVGAQRQLDSLRIYRTFHEACKHCIKQSRQNIGNTGISGT